MARTTHEEQPQAQQVSDLEVDLLGYPAEWNILALAEHHGVALVQMPPGAPERIMAPDPQRAGFEAPLWLPPHPQCAKQVVEVPQDATPQRKAAAVARAVVTHEVRRRGMTKWLHPSFYWKLTQAVCARYPWALALLLAPTNARLLRLPLWLAAARWRWR